MNELIDSITPHVLEALGALLTFAISAIAWQIRAKTGIEIEEKHRLVLHSAVMSGVEASLARGLEAGSDEFMAQVKAHVKVSAGDAVRALVPGDGILDTLAIRYAREAGYIS